MTTSMFTSVIVGCALCIYTVISYFHGQKNATRRVNEILTRFQDSAGCSDALELAREAMALCNFYGIYPPVLAMCTGRHGIYFSAITALTVYLNRARLGRAALDRALSQSSGTEADEYAASVMKAEMEIKQLEKDLAILQSITGPILRLDPA